MKLQDFMEPMTNRSIKKFNHRNFDWGRGMNKDINSNNPVKEPITITTGDVGVCDVAVASPYGNIAEFTFWKRHESEVIEPGEYEVIVRVFGKWNGVQKRKDHSYILEYRGGNRINIREKGQPRWENPDPRPLKQKRTQLPPMSGNSSS